jgi:hypothetical protein
LSAAIYVKEDHFTSAKFLELSWSLLLFMITHKHLRFKSYRQMDNT